MKVIYFDIDTLRPDHLSCCGYGRPTPHIDALAADGVRFSRAYASNTPCMPARAALFTGCFGVVNGLVHTKLHVGTLKHVRPASLGHGYRVPRRHDQVYPRS